MKPARNLWLGIINAICLASLLIWTSKNISLQGVYTHLGEFPKGELIAVCTLNIAVLAIYGLRMSAILNIRFRPALGTIVLGFGLNGMLPFRLGDIAKMVYARQLFGISTARMAAATAIEKLFDLGAVLLLGITAIRFIAFDALYSGIKTLGALLFVALIGLIIANKLHGKLQKRQHRIYVWLTTAIENVQHQFKGRQPVVVGFYTITIWAVTILTTYVMFASLYPEFKWSDAFMLTLVLVLAIAIPGAPAGLGIVEAGIVVYLHKMVGIDTTQAVAAALAFHLAIVLPQILGSIGILIFGAMRNKDR